MVKAAKAEEVTFEVTVEQQSDRTRRGTAERRRVFQDEAEADAFVQRVQARGKAISVQKRRVVEALPIRLQSGSVDVRVDVESRSSKATITINRSFRGAALSIEAGPVRLSSELSDAALRALKVQVDAAIAGIDEEA